MSHLHSDRQNIPDYSSRGGLSTGKEKLINDMHPIERSVNQSAKVFSSDSSQGLGVRFLTFSFYIIFLVLFCVAYYRYVAGMPLPTFTGFLEFIQTCPNVTLNPHFFGSIEADWGIFNFFRDFINTLTTILGVGMYGCTCIIQVITIVAWFIAWAFAIV